MPAPKPPRLCNSRSNSEPVLRSVFASLQIVLAAWVLASCQAPSPHSEADAVEFPVGAIAIGDDVSMVPAGADDAGCPWFRAFSPTKMVVQAMFYRAAE